jgi:hypothetical protein
VKRTILIAFLLVVSQLLLIGTGVLARWLIDCGSDACAGTARAYSPFGSPRDVLLTALAAALPYLLAVFAAAVAWLLAGRAVARPAAEPFAASSTVQAIDRTGAGGTREWRGLRQIAAAVPRSTSKGVFPTAGAEVNGMPSRFEAFRAERTGVAMHWSECEAKLG